MSGHCRAANILPRSGHHTYVQAVLANVLNPKAASIYLTLAPQFLDAREVGLASLLVLAWVHVLTMAVWLTIWSLVLGRSRRVATSGGLAATVDRLGGAILVALGIRTVAS
ncbi:LysE family translocator [uncultured Friedmanniella sp.]|uniref:LysE family translocator n=1 Tax=uncultured Friedmanniella sp. TaxID=335381 RepID=UPI0035CBFDCA